ncbi:hypothetical protein AUR64_01445 [Haloprofundus marisrubri]|uniref:Thioredoxin domain-containing protein n=1 Tax=Haloprofundus marisrubri TaxID=1514971 RepID=A0A0W1R3V2_9EURY|nr:thioredoxin domain-containing protein [Haloprofundus marisrubri]KTG07927.1 hypothetical protein AUR64_01445 [Haloprofundus marisrubri]
MDRYTRREYLRFAGVGAVGVSTSGVAGCLGGREAGADEGKADSPDPGAETAGSDAMGTGTTTGTDEAEASLWATTTLTDVRTDETFTIDQFDRPVLVETFAVWCSNCKRQQDELIAFHEAVGDDVVSVALNVDQNEDAEKVRTHADENGYDWRYAISPPEVTNALVDEFGVSMTNPPSVPMVLRCPDGSARRLKDGQKSTSFLRERTNGC